MANAVNTANAADTANATQHHPVLMDRERFQIGGRDTVLLVWALALCVVIGFLLVAP